MNNSNGVNQMNLNKITTGQTFSYKYGNKDYEFGTFTAKKVVNRAGFIYISAESTYNGLEIKIKVQA